MYVSNEVLEILVLPSSVNTTFPFGNFLLVGSSLSVQHFIVLHQLLPHHYLYSPFLSFENNSETPSSSQLLAIDSPSQYEGM
jgi:hypothetical protein